MPSSGARAIALLLVALAQPAAGQPSARQEYEEATGRPKRAPVIPRELRTMVAETSPDRLVVRGLNGQLIPVSLDWIEPAGFVSYLDGRYFGFAITGYEAGGFTVVDRRASGDGAVIETGQAPTFSPDGRYFAAAEMSEAGFGNLNGVALWEVLTDRTVRRFFTDDVPSSFDWRVDRWVRPDCAALSAIDIGWQPPEGQEWDQAVRSAPRASYAIEVRDEIVLTLSARPCVAERSR